MFLLFDSFTFTWRLLEGDLSASAHEQDGEVGRIELPIVEQHSSLFRCSLRQIISLSFCWTNVLRAFTSLLNISFWVIHLSTISFRIHQTILFCLNNITLLLPLMFAHYHLYNEKTCITCGYMTHRILIKLRLNKCIRPV